MITPNLYTAAKRRRMSLADDDRDFDEGVGAGFASGSKVDVVSGQSFVISGARRAGEDSVGVGIVCKS